MAVSEDTPPTNDGTAIFSYEIPSDLPPGTVVCDVARLTGTRTATTDGVLDLVYTHNGEDTCFVTTVAAATNAAQATPTTAPPPAPTTVTGLAESSTTSTTATTPTTSVSAVSPAAATQPALAAGGTRSATSPVVARTGAGSTTLVALALVVLILGVMLVVNARSDG